MTLLFFERGGNGKSYKKKVFCCFFYAIILYNSGFVELEVDVLPTHDSDELTLYSHEKVGFYFSLCNRYTIIGKEQKISMREPKII